MRCIWSTRTSLLLQKSLSVVSKPGYATIHSRTHLANKSFPPSLQTYRNAYRNVFAGVHGRIPHSRLLAQTAVKVASTHSVARSDKPILPTSSLTNAQISRAAAKAMRICVRSGALADAHYILKSLFSSEFPPPPTVTRKHAPHNPFIPLQFNTYISPRLAAHTLLHELLRVGLTHKAYIVAQNLIKSDFAIHPKTLNLVINRLLAESSNPPNPLSHLRLPSLMGLVFSSKVLQLQPRLFADPSTRYAVRLIQRSQHHRQRCSASALESLVRYFLRRSEILFASLFVCMLVRDYQTRQTMAARLRGDIHACDKPEDADQAADDCKALLQSQLRDVLWHKPPLDKTLIFDLVGTIKETMLKDPEDEPDDIYMQVALQALANIAMLVDERKLPFGDIAPIIRALYSCPISKTKVWVLQRGRAVHVEAHKYFHDVVMRLTTDLPAVRPLRRLKPSDPTPSSIMPPLDIAAYNTLVHYALRHRLDSTLATGVLRHMQALDKPLKPDVVTHNILLRAGTLMSKNFMVEEALGSLRRHRIMALRDAASAIDSKSTAEGLGSLRNQIPNQEHATPSGGNLLVQPAKSTHEAPESFYVADAHTLTSYIMHLTSTGRPHAVIKILFEMLPELATVDHPSWGQATDEDIAVLKKLRIRAQKDYLRRAASLGPHLFVVLLNALCKAGKTGLCERLWLLAKKAELASWRMRDIEPWLLPIHAYTIMLQCYHAEVKKGGPIRIAGRKDVKRPWKPAVQRSARGWAKYIQEQQRSPYDDFLRDNPGRRAGMQLFHAMQDGGKEVFQELMRLKGQRARGIEVPRVDARFFNAALALFSTGPRRVYSRQYFKRKMRKARARYAATGEVSGKWNVVINDVAREMVAHGYSVPIGIRPLLLGRWDNAAFVRRARRTLDIRPYAFLKLNTRLHRTFRAYRLFTMKTRGLPVRVWRRKSRAL